MKQAVLTNDKERLGFLRRMTSRGRKDIEHDATMLPPELLEEAEGLQHTFQTALDDGKRIQARRKRATEQKRTAIDRLDAMNRDFWEVLTRRTRREGHSETILDRFRMINERGRPSDRRETDILINAEAQIEGDTWAISAGYPPMVNPSAEQHQNRLTEALTATEEADTAERELQKTSKHLEHLRERIRILVTKTSHYFQFLMGDEPASKRRNAMRRYGYTFLGNTGEVIEEPEPDQTTESEETNEAA